jgi:hypothetical protein
MWAAYWSNRVLALKGTGVVVTTRPIRYRKQTIQLPDGNEEVVTTPQEKGVDIRFALDVVSLARKRQFDVGPFETIPPSQCLSQPKHLNLMETHLLF